MRDEERKLHHRHDRRLEGVEDINTKAEINEWDHATALPTESNGEGMTKPPKLDKQIPIKLADDVCLLLLMQSFR